MPQLRALPLYILPHLYFVQHLNYTLQFVNHIHIHDPMQVAQLGGAEAGCEGMKSQPIFLPCVVLSLFCFTDPSAGIVGAGNLAEAGGKQRLSQETVFWNSPESVNLSLISLGKRSRR